MISRKLSNPERKFQAKMPKEDITVYAEFELRPFFLSYYDLTAGLGRVVGPARASYGDEVSLTVIPEEGSELLLLMVLDEEIPEEGVVANGDGTYTATLKCRAGG